MPVECAVLDDMVVGMLEVVEMLTPVRIRRGARKIFDTAW